MILNSNVVITLRERKRTHLLLPCYGDCSVDGVQALTEAVGVHGVVVLV